jgi:gamma-glutamyltranspeptidase/glutathione hydrolase
MASCIAQVQDDVRRDEPLAALLLPGGNPLKAGQWLVQADYAQTLRRIARHGAAELAWGELGQRLAEWLRRHGAILTQEDVRNYQPVIREPVRGAYRGFDVIGPPPPCSGGVHVVQMLNLLSHFDVAALGYGTADGVHLLLEAMKIAAADRARYMGDPAFLDVPVARLISQAYARERLAEIDMRQARAFAHGRLDNESANTTHVTVADKQGNVVASTQTINSLFGARMVIPGTGVIANNYMYLFDPHSGRAMSIEPGKRLTSAQAPLIVSKDGRPRLALGLPGGTRIYSTALQTIVNVIDHGMALQDAVEAPRVWTQGQEAEVEPAFDGVVAQALAQRGHAVQQVAHIGGGMCAVEFHGDGSMTGAACWRADGAPAGISGGNAEEGVTFWPERRAAPTLA